MFNINSANIPIISVDVVPINNVIFRYLMAFFDTSYIHSYTVFFVFLGFEYHCCLLCTFFIFHSPFFLAGELYVTNGDSLNTSPYRPGDTITMQIDLRSRTPEKRCVSIAVNGSPADVVVTHIPPSVKFAV